jgi:hypothetical protein
MGFKSVRTKRVIVLQKWLIMGYATRITSRSTFGVLNFNLLADELAGLAQNAFWSVVRLIPKRAVGIGRGVKIAKVVGIFVGRVKWNKHTAWRTRSGSALLRATQFTISVRRKTVSTPTT